MVEDLESDLNSQPDHAHDRKDEGGNLRSLFEQRQPPRARNGDKRGGVCNHLEFGVGQKVLQILYFAHRLMILATFSKLRLAK